MTREQRKREIRNAVRQYLPYKKFPKNAITIMMGFESGAEWADENPHWISVEDELPKENEDVLVLLNNGEYIIADCDAIEAINRNPALFNVTYWMTLPKLVEEG